MQFLQALRWETFHAQLVPLQPLRRLVELQPFLVQSLVLAQLKRPSKQPRRELVASSTREKFSLLALQAQQGRFCSALHRQ